MFEWRRLQVGLVLFLLGQSTAAKASLLASVVKTKGLEKSVYSISLQSVESFISICIPNKGCIILQQISQRFGNLAKIWYETSVIRSYTKKTFISFFVVLGMGNSLTAHNFDLSVNKPLHVKRCPKYKTSCNKNSHLSGCSFKLYDLNLLAPEFFFKFSHILYIKSE